MSQRVEGTSRREIKEVFVAKSSKGVFVRPTGNSRYIPGERQKGREEDAELEITAAIPGMVSRARTC